MNIKKINPLFCLLAGIIALSSCSSTKVISDIDPTEDFSQFKTFEYLGWTNQSDQLLNRFDRERIESSFENEAKKRGLSQVNSKGDIIITLFVGGQVKTRKSANTTHMGMSGMGTRGMRAPGWGWGAGHSTTTIHESSYIEGTLMVEVYDRLDKKLIWQAMATKVVSEDPKRREKEIPKTVKKLMSKYPVKPIK